MSSQDKILVMFYAAFTKLKYSINVFLDLTQMYFKSVVHYFIYDYTYSYF